MKKRIVLTLVALFMGVLLNRQNVLGDPSPNVSLDEHQIPLDRLVGLWACTEHHFDEVGREIAEIKANEQIDWVLDQQVIRRNYSRTTGRTSYRAIGMLSWNQTAKRFEGSWFDNVANTGPSVVQGRWDQAKLQFAFELTVVTGPDTTSTYTVIEAFMNENKRVVTTYEHRNKELIKRMKVIYQRIAPCPASTEIRSISLDEEFSPPKKNKD